MNRRLVSKRIDLHCHILPGLDDGPENLDESIRMAEIAWSERIGNIVATPHIRENIFSPELIREKIRVLNEALNKRDIPVEIHYGADVSVRLPTELMRSYTLNGTGYILIEFPYTHITPSMVRERLFAIMTAGLTPILTHPERNPSVIRDPDAFIDLLSEGMYLQLTASSLTGEFGEEVRACASYLLKRRVVDLIATDAHSVRWRPPLIEDAVEAARRIVGEDAAERLVSGNPARVLTGGPLG